MGVKSYNVENIKNLSSNGEIESYITTKAFDIGKDNKAFSPEKQDVSVEPKNNGLEDASVETSDRGLKDVDTHQPVGPLQIVSQFKSCCVY